MPQSHTNAPSSTPMSAAAQDAALRALADDPDIPLGWECADPALQIERWGQEAPAGSDPG